MALGWSLCVSTGVLAVIVLSVTLPVALLTRDTMPLPATMGFAASPLAAMRVQHQQCPCVAAGVGLATDERALSNAHFRSVSSVPDPRGLSSMAAFWGQFIDHDIVRSEQDAALGNYTLVMAPSDAVLRMTRNVHRVNPTSGCRESTNFNTPLIDGTTVYGDTDATLSRLRVAGACRLTMGPENMLPLAEGGREFVTGDPRGSEHSILASLHTLWAREHNRLCDVLAVRQPAWSEEQRFWKARQVVVAKIQHVTYAEWLPALLGSQAPLLESVPMRRPDAAIDQVFSVVAFRFGHSMIPNPIGSFALPSLFFNAPLLVEHGVEPFLAGAYGTRAERSDPAVIDGLRDFLFATGGPGVMGEDLITRNLFRVRDLGIGTYHNVLACYGEPVPPPFGAEDMEPYVGLLSEPLVPGSSVGRTIAVVVAEQFRRIRAYDPDFYTRSAGAIGAQFFNEILATTLASVIGANTALTAVPEQVFFVV